MRTWTALFSVFPLACASIAELDDFADASVPGAGGAGAAVASATTTAGGANATTTAVGGSSSTVGGGGQGGGEEAWRLYSLSGATGDLSDGTWSNQSLLGAWGGGNAPTEGVLAAAGFHHFNQIIVLTDAGTLHRRDGSIWRPVVPAASLFPLVPTTPETVLSAYTIPGAWPDIGTPQEDRSTEQVIFSGSTPASDTFQLYDVTDAFDTAELIASGVPFDGSEDCSASCTTCEGPMRPSIHEVWGFRILDESLVGAGSNDVFRAWGYYDDGNIYQYGASFCWESIPVADHPLFAGRPNAPPPELIRAAYFDGSAVHMVVASP